MKKVIAVWAAVLLLGFACLILNLHPIRWAIRPPELLQDVGIDDGLRLKIEDYDYWKDPLSYVSGFEAFAARVKPDDWITPEGWHNGGITLAEISQAHELFIQETELHEMDADFFRKFDQWCFIENGSAEEFTDWEYYIGLYGGDGYLAVYRGHDLNSELFLRE